MEGWVGNFIPWNTVTVSKINCADAKFTSTQRREMGTPFLYGGIFFWKYPQCQSSRSWHSNLTPNAVIYTYRVFKLQSKWGLAIQICIPNIPHQECLVRGWLENKWLLAEVPGTEKRLACSCAGGVVDEKGLWWVCFRCRWDVTLSLTHGSHHRSVRKQCCIILPSTRDPVVFEQLGLHSSLRW